MYSWRLRIIYSMINDRSQVMVLFDNHNTWSQPCSSVMNLILSVLAKYAGHAGHVRQSFADVRQRALTLPDILSGRIQYSLVINWVKCLAGDQNVRQSIEGLSDILSGRHEIIFARTACFKTWHCNNSIHVSISVALVETNSRPMGVQLVNVRKTHKMGDPGDLIELAKTVQKVRTSPTYLL